MVAMAFSAAFTNLTLSLLLTLEFLQTILSINSVRINRNIFLKIIDVQLSSHNQHDPSFQLALEI